MDGIGTPELVAWALCFVLQLAVVCLLMLRGHYLQFPAFTVYISGTVAENIAEFAAYQHYGFSSTPARSIAWSMQTVITLLRFLAVAELCRRIFGRYRGIWGLIWRALAIPAGLVAMVAMFAGSHDIEFRVLYADRAANLSLSFVAVAIFAFARYYNVRPSARTQALALGFLLYSCFLVLNDTFLEVAPFAYQQAWNFLGTVAFVGSLLVWGWAVHTAAVEEADPALLPAGVYETLSPDVNRRLASLNERLSGLTKRPERPR